MARVKQKNTVPEMKVRRQLHALGCRFRLHRKDLPGSPDIVLPKLRLAIFVHGCFWHQHPGCKRAKIPATRSEWWARKLMNNQRRDAKALAALDERGWTTAIVWECQTSDATALSGLLRRILKTSNEHHVGMPSEPI
jgi:DNA mismatch endonuclease (patch repair protein)